MYFLIFISLISFYSHADKNLSSLSIKGVITSHPSCITNHNLAKPSFYCEKNNFIDKDFFVKFKIKSFGKQNNIETYII